MLKRLKITLFFYFFSVIHLTFAYQGKQGPPPPTRRNGDAPPPPGLSIDENLYLLFIMAIVIFFVYHQNQTKKVS